MVSTKAMATALLGEGGFLPSCLDKVDGVRPDGIRNYIPAVYYWHVHDELETEDTLQSGTVSSQLQSGECCWASNGY